MVTPRRFCLLIAVVPVCALSMLSCSRSHKPSVNELLQQRGYLKNAFYTCLLNGLAQHLPLKQIQKDCETRLTFNGEGGLTRKTPDLGPAGHSKVAFDPAALHATCNTGDPKRGAGGAGDTVKSGWVYGTTIFGNKYSFGYTYGGKGETGGYRTNENGELGVERYKGLPEEEAKKQKQEAVDKYLQAVKDYDDLVKQQKAELEAQGKDPGDWEKDPKMVAEREAAFKKVSDALKKAEEDPNVEEKLGGITRPAPSNACQDALQEAREFLGQCQMTEWKSAECQSLKARLEGCPDPSLIYVDPEQGYSCRPNIDPQALRQAWMDRCEQLKRPTVDGSNPCSPPQVDSDSRFVEPGDRNQVCGGPQVYVTPDVEPQDRSCVHVLQLPTFEKSLQQIYVWGLNNLGGPIVVFGPRTDSPPTPGPQPRPGPDPNP
jgi:hypothetical protein